jgi:hypothetical protein
MAIATDSDVLEVWEISTEGTVWLWKHDVRHPGQMEKVRVGGRAGGSRRLRISRDERRYNEEQVIEEMAGENPFRNGALVLISTEDRAEDIDSRYHLTEADLASLLELRDEDLFRAEVEDIKSELVMRRLYMAAETKATVGQLDVIRSIIEERYKVGGTQKTVREMMAQGEFSGGTVISG